MGNASLHYAVKAAARSKCSGPLHTRLSIAAPAGRFAGIKSLGEGEWKCKKHGARRRRQWRKLHIGMIPKHCRSGKAD